MTNTVRTAKLSALFGDAIRYDVPIAKNTSARIGGSADAVLTVATADELARAASLCWQENIPFKLIGGGSNILISDAGVRELVILNKAKAIQMPENNHLVYAESGVGFSRLAHIVSDAGYDGLTWAATIPGTVGGAVYGNAGAFGGDVASSLQSVDIITKEGRGTITPQQCAYAYRSSAFKRSEIDAVILGARFNLKNSDAAALKIKLEELSTRRKNTQPPGASMGSMFKNPPNDHAGRLIEACGLKGKQIGGATISPVHANFFVNQGDTSASDVAKLIRLAHNEVKDKFNIALELEIELIGEWSENDR